MKRPIPLHGPSVWPPGALVACFLGAYAVLEAGLWFICFANHINNPGLEDPELRGIRRLVIVLGAIVYPLYRLARFHPAINQSYGHWLKLAPWTAGKPLPLGPIHPVWQDFVVLAGLSLLMAWRHPSEAYLPFASAGFVYLAGLTVLLLFTRQWPASLALGFLWPALLLPGVPGWCLAALTVTIALVVRQGHLASLRAFPWRFLNDSTKPPPRAQSSIWNVDVQLAIPDNRMSGRFPRVGWPLLTLSPKYESGPIPGAISLWLGAVAGWWAYCLILRSAIEARDLAFVVFIVGSLAAMVRLGLYLPNVTAPFNAFGRLATGRIIVPGYDRVFVTPLLAVLVSSVGAAILRAAGAWYPLFGGGLTALLCSLLFGGGPTLRNWLLTGHLRFTLGPMARAQMTNLQRAR